MQKQLAGYSYQFWFLCLNALLFFTALNMALPEFPNWLSRLGGAEHKGYIIGLFTAVAALSRPLGGRLADRIGRLPVMYFGAAVSFICFVSYPHFQTVFLFLLLRSIHGLAVGMHPTGLFALSADIIPADKRGQGVGILSMTASVGMALGPGLGGYLSQYISMFWLCNICALFALISLLSVRAMHETLPEPQPFRWREISLRWSEVFEPRVLLPSVIIIFGSYSFGTMLTLTPDWLMLLGEKNKGLFLTVSTMTSIISRLLSGSISDRYGRVNLLMVSTFVQFVTLLGISHVTNLMELLVGAAFMGLAYGVFSPTLTAWAIDLSHTEHRGRAMATVYVALEIGIGLGALISGYLFKNTLATLSLPMQICAFCSLAACMILWASRFFQKNGKSE